MERGVHSPRSSVPCAQTNVSAIAHSYSRHASQAHHQARAAVGQGVEQGLGGHLLKERVEKRGEREKYKSDNRIT